MMHDNVLNFKAQPTVPVAKVIAPAQFRAARAVLGLRADQVASACQCSLGMLRALESDTFEATAPRIEAGRRLALFYEGKGFVFTVEGDWPSLRWPILTSFIAQEESNSA